MPHATLHPLRWAACVVDLVDGRALPLRAEAATSGPSPPLGSMAEGRGGDVRTKHASDMACAPSCGRWILVELLFFLIEVVCAGMRIGGGGGDGSCGYGWLP